MNNTETPTTKTIAIWFQSDKHGKTRAYRWSMMQFRSFPVGMDKAREMLLDGSAHLVPESPFPKAR